MRFGQIPLNDAIGSTLAGDGRWVAGSFVVIVGGLLPWVFSPLLFQNQMSVILILLMITNLIAALLILPALLAWMQPRALMPALAAASAIEVRDRDAVS